MSTLVLFIASNPQVFDELSVCTYVIVALFPFDARLWLH